MSVIDILTRVDLICKKYDRYDIDKQRELNASGDDAFSRLYASIDSDIDAALEKSDVASTEKNRAAAVALNAEVRRTKARLLEEAAKLQRLAIKKVKGVSKEELTSRNDLVIGILERIQSISDGSAPGGRNTGGWSSSAPRNEIKFDATSDDNFNSEFFQQSEESSQFRNEYEMRKMKQDQGLDVISEGLDALKNIASEMNEELDRQVPLIDEIDTKVDKATSDLKNTNVKLKDTILKMRSSQNMCIDIVLLCVILGIAGYLYKGKNYTPTEAGQFFEDDDRFDFLVSGSDLGVKDNKSSNNTLSNWKSSSDNELFSSDSILLSDRSPKENKSSNVIVSNWNSSSDDELFSSDSRLIARAH